MANNGEEEEEKETEATKATLTIFQFNLVTHSSEQSTSEGGWNPYICLVN